MMGDLETSVIAWGGTRLPYAIRRSARRKKTVAVIVDPSGDVLLVAPEDFSTSRLDAVVRRKAPWIVQRRRHVKSHDPPPSPWEFVSGETVLYLGRKYRLKVHPNETGEAKLHGGCQRSRRRPDAGRCLNSVDKDPCMERHAHKRMQTTDPLLEREESPGCFRGFTRFKYSVSSVICILAFLWGETCNAQEIFSTEREFGPVRFSQQQLVELVGRLHTFAGRQGSTTGESGDARHTLRLSDEQSTIEISGEPSTEALASAPPVATSVRYSRYDRTGAIRRISFSFSDLRRTLQVSGRSRDEVEAVANLADTLIGRAETTFGGSRHRAPVAALLFGLAFGLVYGVGKVDVRPAVGFAMFTTGVLLPVAIWVFPWSEWFPGAAVYQGDPSFLVRHAALIAFLGFFTTISTWVVAVMRIGRVLLKGWAKTETAETGTEDE